ncbi:MAG: calcium-binding protein [Nostoc sp.]|uniref:beta strand repeat-containing protein n=1 Tax=Nostoc sp. TaxID=1180 RepID=UPI002FF8D88C
MADIIGTNGNDTLVGSDEDDTINGKAGNDTILSSYGYNTLTGGGGNDKFVYRNIGNIGYIGDIITDFGGVGKGTHPTAAVIAEVDTLTFSGDGLTARNLELTQNDNNLQISFQGVDGVFVTLQNFALENLDNLSKSTGASVDLGNIQFDGQTSITDSFDVFNANSTQSTIFNKNTVTFLNDLDNNVNGFDNSDDVINGQGGDDLIDGKSGNDYLRGGAGNNTLNGGAGDDTLSADNSSDDNLLSGGDGNDSLSASDGQGNNTLNGGNGDDTLTGGNGDDILTGGNGDDILNGGSGSDILNGGNGDDIFILTGGPGSDTLTGGGGKDKFVYNSLDYHNGATITDFGGVGKGTNPTAAVIAEVDTLTFQGDGFTARNLQLTQNDNNLEISFEGVDGAPLILQNFALENLHNLSLSTGASVDLGNILFNGQTSITDSFDVFNANSTQSTIFNKNTVTFLNDLNNHVNGFDNSDDVINGQGGDDLINGKSGNDFLRGGAGNNTLIGGAGDDTLSADNSSGDNLLFGGDGNDSLFAYNGNNTLNGGNGDDILTGGNGKDILTGGGGKDKFIHNFNYDNSATITDFGGVGKGTHPTAAVIAEVDTLILQGDGLTAQNLLLTENGKNLEISFAGVNGAPLILQNFALENLDNLSKSTGASVDLGNILFDGQTSITDSFDVFNANSTQSTIFNKNTVTFLNDLNNHVDGFDNSDDTINGQGGDDLIDGKSGNDFLRGCLGNDSLVGGAGDDSLFGGTGNESFTQNDSLVGGAGNDSLVGGTGNDYLDIQFSTGNNTLKGGVGDDNLIATGSTGKNLLFGDDGNDSLDIASFPSGAAGSTGNNTLNGGAGNDTLTASGSYGDNLLSGGDGNDALNISGAQTYSSGNSTTGSNTLNGGAGDDTLTASGSYGSNLLSGGDGNDFLDISGSNSGDDEGFGSSNSQSTGNNTLNGGAGDDTLNAGGSTGNNLLSGGDGNDYLDISGSSSANRYGYFDGQTSRNNTLNGGAGNDTLDASGSSGNNILYGGTGKDVLIATDSTGNNILNGGAGNDSLYGGEGNDTFAFDSYKEGSDSLYDFHATKDRIQVSAHGFDGGLSTHSLKADQFTIGTSATTSNQRFIYNDITGALYFDLDGSAHGFTQVKFAQLSAGLSLTKNNFVVV